MIYLILLSVLAAGFFLYMTIWEPRRMMIRNINVEGELKQPLKIAFFSDIHFTAFNFGYRSRNILNTLQNIQPDLIIFGGDLIDIQWEDTAFLIKLQTFLKELKAPHGTYAVCGNHDASYISHKTYASFMRSCGIQVLNNEMISLPDLEIAIGGLEDALFGTQDKELYHARTMPFQILISHEPDVMDNVNLNHVDLALSGHTHGGQIRVPILTKLVLPKLGRRYVKGLYTIHSAKLIVSSGIGGALFSARFRNTPEILEIHCIPRSHPN